MEKELNHELIETEVHFSLSNLFMTWLFIGATSFGGGAVTHYLIQEKFIYQKRWLTDKEYANILGISQLTPGVNILAITILIGHKLAGLKGSLLSLLGITFPSAAITILLSFFYVQVSAFPLMQKCLRSAFAAIFGISIITNWRNLRPIFKRGQASGRLPLFIFSGICLGTMLLYLTVNPPVLLLYFLGCFLGILTHCFLIKKAGDKTC